ncbi:hypothetical protein [Legionella clemsonensis]|uniref:Uncharacterized protein n=1 Tax=Legionella clemsonensis TaxID=1867846 RepID=A0A222P2J5_9GAMM|nr:hypothetical protein [Legionella clemsonensis]ASQ46066.1 hypothetical protein clem_07565 [Legionella clemsonensis]
MYYCSVKRFRLLPVLITSVFLFLAAGFFAATAQAATSTPLTPSANKTELAYFYVYDRYPGRYWGPRRYYHRNVYWTGWRTYYYRHGYRCQRNCLINRWNGAIIRCAKRCF